MNTVAIITARGGSKRIHKKNIREFCGKPIIAYGIEAALNSKVFEEVMVSTDSEEIAAIAREYGASVPFFRSKTTSDDLATTADVIAEVIHEYQKAGRVFEYFACIYPTAAFITGEKLSAASKMLVDKRGDSVISVVKYGFPPQRAFVIRDELLAYQYPQYEKVRSQDLEPIYHDCGQFYICSIDSFNRYHSLVLPRTIPYVIPEEEAQDIDTMSDWAVAEAKYTALHYLHQERR